MQSDMEMGTMKRNFRKLATGLSLAVMLCLGAGTLRGQSAAEKTLLQKAASQEQSGHIDLAAQTWQQVLLSDPNNEEALAGLGRWAKLTGNEAEAETYLDRLRAVNPNSPEIAKIEALVSNKTQNQLLEQAAELAKNGHNEEALKIYRQTFGTHPPDNWALAYYDTEAGIPATREDAIDGLRGLTAKYPSDPQYAIDLGRVLTYDPRTRAEGEKILSQYPQDAAALTSLRQALGWDVQNPATMPAVREYLKLHPDAELAKELAETETRQAQATAGIARTPAEQAAFRELAANHLPIAEQMFVDLSVKQPTNPRVLAGLGFVRMKQSNFGEAARDFEEAEQNGLKIPLIAQSLATAQFWYAMQQGTEALNANRLDEAVRQYKAALGLRAGNVDALSGEAGAYMKMQLPDQAVPVYQALLKKQPKSAVWWRGLFNAQAQAGEGKAAIATEGEFPAALKASVARDPDYLRNLAQAYVGAGQDAQAQKILLQAINLKYAPGQERIRDEVTLQYAALLAQDKNYPQAAAIYQKMLRSDPNNVSAWQGMVSLQHLAGRDADAIAMVERMPPDAYEGALHDGGFLSMLAAIYQSQNHPDVAEGFLERAIRIYQDNGQSLPIPLQLQVAALDLERNHAEGAYNIYRSVLTQHPDNLNAWKGLLAALHATDHDADAMAQLEQIPPEVRKALATDVEYQQTLAAIYAANGDERGALALLTEVENSYRAAGKRPPATVDIADAWTLFNVGDDRRFVPATDGAGRSAGHDRRATAAGADALGNVGAEAGGTGRGGEESSARGRDIDGGSGGVPGKSGGEQGAGGGVCAGRAAEGCDGDLCIAGYDERVGVGLPEHGGRGDRGAEHEAGRGVAARGAGKVSQRCQGAGDGGAIRDGARRSRTGCRLLEGVAERDAGGGTNGDSGAQTGSAGPGEADEAGEADRSGEPAESGGRDGRGCERWRAAAELQQSEPDAGEPAAAGAGSLLHGYGAG